ncbi:MAG TPA: YafY family protein [Rhizomicrobium sp.]|nr:YafY family protein [Rhizomicrobium sp.]
MLASRLLSILMLLQTRGGMSASALAAEFEVSVRTIHRDIDALSAAGIPVYAERGRSGGFRLMDGYRTRLTGLTQPEAETLFLAGLPGPAAELGLADLIAATRLKLLAALPASQQPGAEKVAQRFHLDPAGWFRAAEGSELLPEIARAVWNERYLRTGYRSGGEVRPRKLGPLGLVLKGGVWYLVAEYAKRILTWRASAIVEAEMLDEPFARPRRFDLAAHWAAASRAYEEGLYSDRAKVRLSPRGRMLLAPHVSARVEAFAARTDEDGWLTCDMPIEPGRQGLRELMRLGADVEVLGPPNLRAQLHAEAKALAGRHAPTAGAKDTRRAGLRPAS